MASSRYEVVSQTVEELLSPGAAQFEVPPFQRTYAWGADEINQLVDDVFGEPAGSELPYFLGSIVLAHKEENGRAGPALVLDGQQRLTTISLMVAALTDKAIKSGAEDANDYKTYLFSRRERRERRARVTLQNEDQKVYQSLVREPSDYDQPRFKGTQIAAGLGKIYNAIEKYSSSMQTPGTGSTPYEAMLDRLLYDVEIVKITTPSENDAFRLFETLNDRGLALSAADLIKNKLFSRCGSELEDAIDAWSSIIALTRSDDIVGFLRYFWIAVYDFVRKRGLYDKYRRHIDTLDPTEATLFALELDDAAKDYEQIIDPKTSSWGSESADTLERLNTYGARSCRPAILACSKFRSSDLQRILGVCESITVRYSIVGEKNPNRLEVIYSEMCKALRDRDATLVEIFGSSPLLDLLGEVPSDEEFGSKLKSAQISSITTAWREILVRLNHRMSTGETRIESPNRVHVEHILPQNPRATALTEAGISREYAATLASRLGNLTLLSGRRNRELSNKPFSEKLNSYTTSEIAMTRGLGEFDGWDEYQIEARSKRFADLAVDTYPHPLQVIR